jgi:hypothetical protein
MSKKTPDRFFAISTLRVWIEGIMICLAVISFCLFYAKYSRWEMKSSVREKKSVIVPSGA